MGNTKFFKTVEFEGTEEEFYSLFVCHKDTPIPTAEEIVKRNGLNECCKNDKVVEITREEFLIYRLICWQVLSTMLKMQWLGRQILRD